MLIVAWSYSELHRDAHNYFPELLRVQFSSVQFSSVLFNSDRWMLALKIESCLSSSLWDLICARFSVGVGFSLGFSLWFRLGWCLHTLVDILLCICLCLLGQVSGNIKKV
jgi:hypothetical protein